MNGPVTHIAGQCITVHGVYMRQRCSWCGAILLDYDLRNIAVPIEQAWTPPCQWTVGDLVRVEGDFPKCYSVVEYVDKLPADACAMLDPEVTA